MKGAKRRATDSGREFDLSTEVIEEALARGVCSVTGLPFVMTPTDGKAHPLSPSIDRIDSSRGYTDNNIRVVVWAVNMACSTWGLEATLAIFSHALGVPTASTNATIAALLQEQP